MVVERLDLWWLYSEEYVGPRTNAAGIVTLCGLSYIVLFGLTNQEDKLLHQCLIHRITFASLSLPIPFSMKFSVISREMGIYLDLSTVEIK
jgi:hypothetical protein